MHNTREKLIDAIEKEKPYIPTSDYEVGYNNGLVMAQSIILATDNNVGSKWIPVTERLPETFKSVLGYDLEKGRNVFWYDEKGFNDVDEYGHTYPIKTVTHWMPLPEAPKGE